jgi:cytochrome c oxidase subunit II
MLRNLPFFPEQASVQAGQVDAVYFFMVAVAAFFSLLIAGLIVFFAVKYRRREDDGIGVAIHGSLTLELLWTFVPLGIVMVMFVWGAKVFFDLYRPPAGAMEIFVVGKQWMWKVQHMEGQREINELHVPVGRPVKLIMGSEDVLHSYYIPAFRVKADVIPGRYNTMWFTANKPGQYHLFCAEYCGTKHSGMVGQVVVLEPDEYEAWLATGRAEGSLASAGGKLFQDLACNTCHRPDAQGRGPILQGLYGKTITLASGERQVVDEAYLRESILNPGEKVTQGFQPVMPAYQGLVTEDGVLQLIEYLKSLQSGALTAPLRPAIGGPAAGEARPARGNEVR